jgi:hypothetical protein
MARSARSCSPAPTNRETTLIVPLERPSEPKADEVVLKAELEAGDRRAPEREAHHEEVRDSEQRPKASRNHHWDREIERLGPLLAVDEAEPRQQGGKAENDCVQTIA